MTWITPVTDWSNGNRFTYEDMNRIAGNINHLSAAGIKDDYTQDDYLTAEAWLSLTTALSNLVAVTGLNRTVAGWEGTAETINSIEGLTQDLYDRIELINAQASATIYAGDNLYVAQPVENYVRGV